MAFLYLLKHHEQTNEREVVFMMTATIKSMFTVLGQVFNKTQFIVRSILEKVYFVIHKYTLSILSRTLSEYVY